MAQLALLRRWAASARRSCERSSGTRREQSSSCGRGLMKVAIIGASSKTGRSLALCLKQSGLIDELAIHDVRPTSGLRQELSHTARCRSVRHDGEAGSTDLERALRGAKVLALASSRTRLSEEAQDLQRIVPEIAECCPKALVAVVSRSVNSLVPMLFELFKKTGSLDGRRLFGVLSLYSARANSFAAETLGVAPEFVSVPVVGGGCSKTCVPLFSHSRPCADFTPEELSKLMYSMRSSDELVRSACEESGQPASDAGALCLGFAAARFCISLCKALRDERGVEECAYVRSCLLPEVKYFGERLALGPCGIQKHLGVPRLTNQECTALYEAIPEIKKKIALGEMLALGARSTSTEICPVPARCSALQLYQPARGSCKVG